MKYLIVAVVIAVVFWLIRSSRRANQGDSPAKRGAERTQVKAPEQMVVCARCGVHLPASEALRDNGRYYCCAEHRQGAGT